MDGNAFDIVSGIDGRHIDYVESGPVWPLLKRRCYINYPSVILILGEMAFGMTVLGASKLLMLSTLGAVRVSPEADLAVLPAGLASTSTD